MTNKFVLLGTVNTQCYDCNVPLKCSHIKNIDTGTTTVICDACMNIKMITLNQCHSRVSFHDYSKKRQPKQKT